MTQLMQRLIEELRSVPDEEQDEVAAPLIEELRARRRPEELDAGPYAFLKTLKEANLQLRPDYAATYERDLYGRDADLD